MTLEQVYFTEVPVADDPSADPEGSAESFPLEVFDILASPEGVAERRQWLTDQLMGEYDASIGYIRKLMIQQELAREEAIVAAKADDLDTKYQKQNQVNRIQDRVETLYGMSALPEYQRLSHAETMIDKPDPVLEYWGDEAEKLLSTLTSEMGETEFVGHATELDPQALAELSVGEVAAALARRAFIAKADLQAHEVPEARLMLTFDSPVAVPLDRVVAAPKAHDSWAGRGLHTLQDGLGEKRYQRADGEWVLGSSVGAITAYASRSSEIPAIKELVAYIQPNGEVIFAGTSEGHRLSAAMLKGQSTVGVTKLSIKHLDKDFFSAEELQHNPHVPELLHATRKSVQWEGLFSDLERLGLTGLDKARRLDWMREHGSANELITFVSAIHAQLEPNVEASPIDRPHSLTDGRPLMKPEERYAAYQYAAKLIADILNLEVNNEADQKAALDRVSNILVYTILESHAFKDANGRTARVVAELIREGFAHEPDQVKDLMILGKTRPTDGGFRYNTYIPKLIEAKTFAENLQPLGGLEIPLSMPETYRVSITDTLAVPSFHAV